MKPVAQNQDVMCIVINKYIYNTTTVSNQSINGHTSSAPHVVFQRLDTDDIINCEVNPIIYDCLVYGDTCILWHSIGNYTYKGIY